MSGLTSELVSYIYSVFWYLRRAWPLTVVYGAPLTEPVTSTQRIVVKLLALLKTSQARTESINEEMLNLLQCLPKGENWLSVVDSDTGFDILQTAIIHRQETSSMVFKIVQRTRDFIHDVCDCPTDKRLHT
ncbi:hypothetical protein RRG08_036243 [Elysia crispata]|uniref:Uncharacterized protein n=1 Tax=Elysia crispata TaxID=231223 RepID=A0AAE1CEN9_9GAST|nr:hypothetical protein RRG08_036243 [Elysia crispata]